MYSGVYALRRRSTSRCAAPTPTRCRSTPIAAPAGRRRPTRSSGWSTRRARDLGIAPAELRRRNFIRPEAMPYRDGDAASPTTAAISRAAWTQALGARRCRRLRARRAAGPGARPAARPGHRLLYRAMLRRRRRECADRGAARGRVRDLLIGTQSNGQGHATAYAQLLADALGLPLDQIETMQGDTDLDRHGRGTGGSRSVPVGGAAVQQAADRRCRRRASRSPPICWRPPRPTSTSRTAASASSAPTAAWACSRWRGARAGEQRPARAAAPSSRSAPTFPNGCHVCEVEIDPATGDAEIVRYTVVDDFGTVINPLLVAGQVHGGVAQGIGQALLEHTVYDAETGQLLTGSLHRLRHAPRRGHAGDRLHLRSRCRARPTRWA